MINVFNNNRDRTFMYKNKKDELATRPVHSLKIN